MQKHHPPPASRCLYAGPYARRAVCSLPLVLAAPGVALAEPEPGELRPPVGVLDSGLSPLRYALGVRRRKQEACYDAGDCYSPVPYYAIECERGDSECLARKRRLAREEITSFQTDPLSSPPLLVFLGGAALQLGTAFVRLVANILRGGE